MVWNLWIYEVILWKDVQALRRPWMKNVLR